MHLDPFIPVFVSIIVALAAMSIFAHIIKQPPVLAYILTGIILGPFGLQIIDDSEVLHRIGAIGVIFLLFFIGMEISPEKLARNWRVSLLGTTLQIIISVAAVAVLGFVLKWSLNRCLLLGFVISLSSTAVVLKLLDDRGELRTGEGQDVMGILLAQDLAIIPMMILISMLGHDGFDGGRLFRQLSGAVLLVAIVVFISRSRRFHIPFGGIVRQDKELQVLVSLLVCFGMALISGYLQLSGALGAFIGGMMVGSTRATEWVQQSLHSFRVFFMALFFVSVGILIDFDFFSRHWFKILVLLSFVLFTNTFINALVLRCFGRRWSSSFYAGAMLAQIGEFSFMLATIGLQAAIISEFGYQMTLCIIALSLLVSPFWIGAASRLTAHQSTK